METSIKANTLRMFPCGLTTNPLLFSSQNQSAVIGGYYNGRSLSRYLSLDLCSIVHLFEASELQREELIKKYFYDQRVRVTMAALTGSKSLETLTFHDFSRKVSLHKGKYGYGGIKSLTETQNGEKEYKVQPINLKYFLDTQPIKFQNHIHLDIEGEEINVIRSFGPELKYYCRQLSLELEAGNQKILLNEYIELIKASNYEYACLIISPDCKLIPLSQYQDTLTDVSIKGVHIYMVKLNLLNYLKLICDGDSEPILPEKYAGFIRPYIDGIKTCTSPNI